MQGLNPVKAMCEETSGEQEGFWSLVAAQAQA
jgi:hypothetical protein